MSDKDKPLSTAERKNPAYAMGGGKSEADYQSFIARYEATVLELLDEVLNGRGRQRDLDAENVMCRRVNVELREQVAELEGENDRRLEINIALVASEKELRTQLEVKTELLNTWFGERVAALEARLDAKGTE